MPPARAARLGRLASWLGRHPAAGLAGLPVVVFGLPAAAGRLLIGDDNLVQNFPLRVLVGWDLRHLRPPLWDPYIWAGTPLLAGFNAGAAYPATWLFALVPSRAAFFVNQALVFSLAAVGVWRLLRDYSCSQLAAVLGGASFAWGGFVSAQLVHLDLAEAASLLPWALVGLRRFATRPPGRRALGWLALTTAAFGLILLSGAPEAASCAGVTVAVYTLSLAWEHRDRWASTLAGGAGALAGALALGAVQVVPGLAFASHSQRATASYVFFTGGSLPPELAILAVLPYLLGGYGRLGVPEYFGQYNLAEVTSYVGVLPLLAALALLVPTLRRRPESRPWR
ncbi:MAG TPA: hypothetical protein VKY15_07775, partial [Acidimicrobiales bacterium]|nr:hypothetical protein [Acidimicrobiales bacterium]